MICKFSGNFPENLKIVEFPKSEPFMNSTEVPGGRSNEIEILGKKFMKISVYLSSLSSFPLFFFSEYSGRGFAIATGKPKFSIEWKAFVISLKYSSKIGKEKVSLYELWIRTSLLSRCAALVSFFLKG